DEIRVVAVVEPVTAFHELGPEIAQVRDRAAEGNQAQLQEGQQDLDGGTGHAMDASRSATASARPLPNEFNRPFPRGARPWERPRAARSVPGPASRRYPRRSFRPRSY